MMSTCGVQVPEWFASLHFPVPPNTSVPDFVLDLLNNSFSNERCPSHDRFFSWRE